jgi:hypothetical protein
MMKILYKEEQRFTQWWIWLLICLSFLVPAILLAIEISEQGIANELLVSFIVVVVTGLLVIIGVRTMKLQTQVTTESIRLRFPPFFIKWKHFDKNDIEKYEVRSYKPIAEYGGWGVRFRNRSNRAYNVKGKQGLQLHLINGKKVLIGTQRKQAIAYAMEKLMNPA